MRWLILTFTLLLLPVMTAVTTSFPSNNVGRKQKSGVSVKPVKGGAQQRMQFRGRPPLEPIEIFGNAWRIYASGVIDADAATRLKAYIDENKIPARSILFLHSPGGSLIGGMKLGQTIRDAGLYTYVGQDSGDPQKSMTPGECYSACTLAFLGGKFRWIDSASIYGVHRFNFTAKIAQDIDVTQIMSASIVQYIRDMGVDPKLFSAMTTASSDSMTVLSQKQLKQLKVVNDGFDSTYWTIETVKNALYLKGARETWRGVNKFMLICQPGKAITLYVIFDPEGRGDLALQMKAYSLFIDDKTIPISDHLYIPPTLNQESGWINVAFLLDKDLLVALQSAKEVGVMFQFAYDAPVFLGFVGMDFSEGAQKLPALVAHCPPR